MGKGWVACKNILTVDIYPNSQLGSDAEMLTGLIAGDIQMWISSNTPIAPYIPECAILDMPGLFDSVEHCNSVYADGSMVETFNDLAKDLGFQFAFILANDFRAFSCSKPVYTLEDFAGLDIRISESPYQIAFIEALGANAVPMAFGEVATAIQQGLVDAQYNPVDSVIRNHFYEFQDYVLDDHLMMYSITACINTDFYNSLPEKYQAAYDEAIAELYEEGPDIIAEVFDTYRPQLEEYGVEVITYDEAEHQKLVDATRPVLEKMFREDFGDEFVDAILAACGK